MATLATRQPCQLDAPLPWPARHNKTTVNAAEAVAFINAGGYIGVADALVARKRGTGFTGVMAHVIRQEKQLF